MIAGSSHARACPVPRATPPTSQPRRNRTTPSSIHTRWLRSPKAVKPSLAKPHCSHIGYHRYHRPSEDPGGYTEPVASTLGFGPGLTLESVPVWELPIQHNCFVDLHTRVSESRMPAGARFRRRPGPSSSPTEY